MLAVHMHLLRLIPQCPMLLLKSELQEVAYEYINSAKTHKCFASYSLYKGQLPHYQGLSLSQLVSDGLVENYEIFGEPVTLTGLTELALYY